jgi:hypothetical protein
LLELLPMKRTFCPPEQPEQEATAAAPFSVPLSAS